MQKSIYFFLLEARCGVFLTAVPFDNDTAKLFNCTFYFCTLRAKRFAGFLLLLCRYPNERGEAKFRLRLALCHVVLAFPYGIAPIFAIDFANIERDWKIIESVFSPTNVSIAAEQDFEPDFGIAAIRMGFRPGSSWSFPFAMFNHFAQVNESLFTMSVSVPVGGIRHAASFDATVEVFKNILALMDDENRASIKDLAPRQQFFSKHPVYLSIEAVMGQPTRGQHDVFVPFEVRDVEALDQELFLKAQQLGEDSDSKP